MYRLLTDWDESTVTWLNASADAPWGNEGGDYTEENSLQIDYVPSPSWENYDVTPMVQLFVDGTPNYGFIIIPDVQSGNSGRNYVSSESTEFDTLRPKLTVTYVPTGIITSTQGKELLKGTRVFTDRSVIKVFIPFEKNYSLSICDPKGRIIETVHCSKSEWHQFEIRNLSAGIYFLHIYVDGRTAGTRVPLLR